MTLKEPYKKCAIIVIASLLICGAGYLLLKDPAPLCPRSLNASLAIKESGTNNTYYRDTKLHFHPTNDNIIYNKNSRKLVCHFKLSKRIDFNGKKTNITEENLIQNCLGAKIQININDQGFRGSSPILPLLFYAGTENTCAYTLTGWGSPLSVEKPLTIERK